MTRLNLSNWLGLTVVLGATAFLIGDPHFASPTRTAVMPAKLDALCFMLAGVALLLPRSQRRTCNVVYLISGAILALIASVELLEVTLNARFDRSLRGDWWGTDERISANAATAFLLVGITLMGINQVTRKWQAALIQFASVGLLAMGLLDAGGGLFRIDAFYTWYERTRMPTLTALGVIALALALWSLTYRAEWYQRLSAGAEDTNITFIGGVVLLLVALTAGLVGSGILAEQAETTLKNSLAMSLESRLRLFQMSIERAANSVVSISQRPRLATLLGRITNGIATAAERDEVERIILDNIVNTTDVSALELRDGRGRSIGARGALMGQGKIQARLRERPRIVLKWRERLVLNVEVTIFSQQQPVGTVIGDVALPEVERLFSEVAGLGSAGTMALCAPDGSGMQCFPTRLEPQGLKARRDYQGGSVPMDYALAGQTGVVKAVDARGDQVIAAYSPVAGMNLGMVLKVGTEEMYAPIRAQFQRILLVVFGLVFLGIVLLRWQIRPLVQRLMHEIGERRNIEERLRHLASHDVLTGLPNRALLQERLKQTMSDAQRHDRLMAVMFLDLDRFKVINDTLGHEAGDRLLQAVAARLQSCARAGDTIARLGGDEFTLILSDIKYVDDAARIAQKMLDAVAQPLRVGDRELFVSASIGITLFPFDSDNVDSLLRNADIAMYRAKEQGRNTFQFYTAEMNARALERLSLEGGLRKALERDELRAYYQPQVDLRSGRVIGAEVVLRWQHPEFGLMLPNQFISLAEETGLIVPIGEWILRAACRQNRLWQDDGLEPIRIAVNLSSRQFRQQQLADTVAAILAESGLAPRYLALELTESVVMQQAQPTDTILESLHAQGIELAIDDFGTGYSALSYLKRFPIDVLKIDRSFVRDIAINANDAALCNGIIAMAHSLGIRVIAEGIESPEQARYLHDCGCDAVQGYHYSPPLIAADFGEVLRHGLNAPAYSDQTHLDITLTR